MPRTTYVVPREVTSNLESGQYFVIVQHPMENTTFDINVSGDYVRSLQLNNGTNLFRISGPGSLQGNDAAEALVAAFSDPNNGDDTYTEIPFQVDDAGISTPQAQPATTTPVQRQTQSSLLPVCPGRSNRPGFGNCSVASALGSGFLQPSLKRDYLPAE